MDTVTYIVLIVGIALAGVLAYVLYTKRSSGSAELDEARSDLRAARASLKTAEKAHADAIRSAEKDLGRAEKSHTKAINSLKSSIQKLSDPKGNVLGSYRGVTLYETWIKTPHGQSRLAGTSASVDAQISSRLTATRLVALGVFALAAPKKNGSVYLSIDNVDLVSVVECPAQDNTRAREFAVKIMNASRKAAATEQLRAGSLAATKTRLAQEEVNTGAIEMARGALADVKTDQGFVRTVDQWRERVAIAEHRVATCLRELESTPA